MKLHFNKTEQGNIEVKIEKDLLQIDFDYIEMLQQLIVNNEITCDWGNLEEIEQQKLQELLNQIKQAIKSGLENPVE